MGILDDAERRAAELDALERKAREASADSSMRKMLAAEREPLQWVIPDVLPVGLSLIIGSPKIGKGYMLLDLAVSAWLGEMPFGQRGELEPADVLYIDLEESKELVMERVDTMGVVGGPRNGAPVDITWRWKADIIEEGAVAALRDWLMAHRTRAKLVLIDTWVKFCDPSASHLRGLNAYERDSKMFTPIQHLAREFGVAIMASFHQKKTGRWDSSDPFESVSGSMGSIGSADAIWHLRRPSREEPEATLTIGGRMIRRERSYAMWFDERTATWLLRGADDEAVTSEMREVIGVLAEGESGGLTRGQLYAEIGIEKDALKKRLQRMRTKGLVRLVGKRPAARWQLTDIGRMYLKPPPQMTNPRPKRGHIMSNSGGHPPLSPTCPPRDEYNGNGKTKSFEPAGGGHQGDTPRVPLNGSHNQDVELKGTGGDALVSFPLGVVDTLVSTEEKEITPVPLDPDASAVVSDAVAERLRTAVAPACENAGIAVGDFLSTLDLAEWDAYLDDIEAEPDLVGRLIEHRLRSGRLTR